MWICMLKQPRAGYHRISAECRLMSRLLQVCGVRLQPGMYHSLKQGIILLTLQIHHSFCLSTTVRSVVNLPWHQQCHSTTFSLGVSIVCTCVISSLLHSINLMLFTVLLVHLILRISPYQSSQSSPSFSPLSRPQPSTPDLKLISVTNPFLQSFWFLLDWLHGHGSWTLRGAGGVCFSSFFLRLFLFLVRLCVLEYADHTLPNSLSYDNTNAMQSSSSIVLLVS